MAKAEWGNYGETREETWKEKIKKILKDEVWVWNTYSWHGSVGRRRAVSNFTLIGKKNVMMDISGNMNGNKEKVTWTVWTKRKTCTTVMLAKSKSILYFAASEFTHVIWGYIKSTTGEENSIKEIQWIKILDDSVYLSN